jgi:hypothetical protein
MIDRVTRTANGFAEAAALDRQDVAAMTFEERISEVERLRSIWFGVDRAESRLSFGFGNVTPTFRRLGQHLSTARLAVGDEGERARLQTASRSSASVGGTEHVCPRRALTEAEARWPIVSGVGWCAAM